jgi:hypothetical protein
MVNTARYPPRRRRNSASAPKTVRRPGVPGVGRRRPTECGCGASRISGRTPIPSITSIAGPNKVDRVAAVAHPHLRRALDHRRGEPEPVQAVHRHWAVTFAPERGSHDFFVTAPGEVVCSHEIYADDVVLEFPLGRNASAAKRIFIAFRPAYPARVAIGSHSTIGRQVLWVNRVLSLTLRCRPSTQRRWPGTRRPAPETGMRPAHGRP